ncbi:hypothetical protein [Hyphomicrobium sp.]|uniref:hypothetical protein n=1 Tax=Hyphomicrobium sp. TaxID=82 RepID=UPI0025C4B1C7|nr:hypothetical protein [Hyphomicrobium sp.]MCC7253163.1 hypothetical protein [Hyphomicrobium sp.]
MLEMVRSSASLFFQGKLFAEPLKAYTQLALGILIAAIVLVAAREGGLALVPAAALAGFIAGALQPYLFRNLRYR